MMRACGIAVLVVLVAGVGDTLQGQDTAAVRLAGDSIRVRFLDADLRAVVQAVGRYLPKPVVSGNLPAVRVSLETPSPVSRATLAALLKGLVEGQNSEFTEDSAFIRIQLGKSKSEALRRLGLDTTGATNWRRIEREIKAVSACRLQIGYSNAEASHTLNTNPISQFTAWVTPHDRQLSLAPVTVTLSVEFFESLMEYGAPLDPRAVAWLAEKRAPFALDVYTWLAHRLDRVPPEGMRIAWNMLRDQFMDAGGGTEASKNFKGRFLRALELAREVYPAARLDRWGCGITLLKSPPPVPRSLFVALTGGKKDAPALSPASPATGTRE
ncbi:MAG: replication protein RepA [Gemmatimonadales bacterium]